MASKKNLRARLAVVKQKVSTLRGEVAAERFKRREADTEVARLRAERLTVLEDLRSVADRLMSSGTMPDPAYEFTLGADARAGTLLMVDQATGRLVPADGSEPVGHRWTLRFDGQAGEPLVWDVTHGYVYPDTPAGRIQQAALHADNYSFPQRVVIGSYPNLTGTFDDAAGAAYGGAADWPADKNPFPYVEPEPKVEVHEWKVGDEVTTIPILGVDGKGEGYAVFRGNVDAAKLIETIGNPLTAAEDEADAPVLETEVWCKADEGGSLRRRSVTYDPDDERDLGEYRRMADLLTEAGYIMVWPEAGS